MTKKNPPKQVERELDEHMKLPKVKLEIEKLSMKTGVDFKICESMYRASARDVIKNKEFWSKFKVVK